MGIRRPSYAVTDLATYVAVILDALGIRRAHVVGISMGGILVQLLLLDHLDRLLTATMLCTSALGAGLAANPDDPGTAELPGPESARPAHRRA